jgi:hypothetical protein
MTSQSPDEIILYQSPDGSTCLEVSLHEDTIWLAQSQLAKLFDVNVPAVSKHVRNILGSGELDASATVSKMERVQIEGGREVKRSQVLYNLDMIISIGYRVSSAKATSFRIWATNPYRQGIHSQRAASAGRKYQAAGDAANHGIADPHPCCTGVGHRYRQGCAQGHYRLCVCFNSAGSLRPWHIKY